MDWNHCRVLGPRWVDTPNIESEISRLFYRGEEDVNPPVTTLGQEQIAKLKVLAERLEFVDHLTIIALEFRSQTIHIPSLKNLGDDKIILTDILQLQLWGHDFAGADLDIEALVAYLLFTCIDTIKGQPEHVTAFEWMCKHKTDRLLDLKSDKVCSVLTELANAYSNEHGIGRRFKDAFVVDLSGVYKERLTKSIAVVKIVNGMIPQASSSAWEQRTPEKKILKIAETFYRMRSRFTHAAIRSFCPVQPIKTILGEKEAVVVQLPDGEKFLQLMRDIVVFLARKLVINHPNP